MILLAPTWTLLKALNTVVKAQCIHGLDFSSRTSRASPYNPTVWSLIELGKLSNLQQMTKTNALPPFHMNPSMQSLLKVSTLSSESPFIYSKLSMSTPACRNPQTERDLPVPLSLNADPDLHNASAM